MDYLESLEEDVNRDLACKIKLEKSIYSKETILKSCYKYTDEAYIYIDTSKDSNTDFFNVYLQSKDSSKCKVTVDQFMNELLDQELRTIIYKETKKVRDTIVTRALLSGQPNED